MPRSIHFLVKMNLEEPIVREFPNCESRDNVCNCLYNYITLDLKCFLAISDISLFLVSLYNYISLEHQVEFAGKLDPNSESRARAACKVAHLR